MNTNDCIKEVHAALVAKVKARAAVDGNNKLALEISGKVAEYGADWATAFGNDGKLDDEEEQKLNEKFNAIIDEYLPKKDGTIVDKAWDGFSICFINVFKGVKAYLNQWFDLGLKTIALGFVAFAMCGCVYKGAKVTEGTDLAVGMNVPCSEGTLQLQVLNYLSGFRVGVDRNAIMTIKYTVAETNDYFGCIHTKVAKTADVTVEPCEVTAEATAEAK